MLTSDGAPSICVHVFRGIRSKLIVPEMGIKADLKQARARMQAGEPSQAQSMIKTILESGSPELEDKQTLYAVLVTSGLAGLAAEDYEVSEASFRQAADTVPDAPQAWKGLMDCLERAGKTESLPEALLPAAEIAEGKQNYARARTMRLRLAQVLEGQGKFEEALEALKRFLDNPGAVAACSLAETLPLLLHAAIIEEAVEAAAVAKRVEKRIAKEGGVGASSTEAPCRARLTFEYRAKALRKDDEEAGSFGRRLTDGMKALETLAASAAGDTQPSSSAPSDLVAAFCRVVLRRAVHRAEFASSKADRWHDVLDVCSALETATAWLGPDADDGWFVTTKLLVSMFEPEIPWEDLSRVALEGVRNPDRPWLTSEACLNQAWLALDAGDAARADELLKTSQSERSRGPRNDGWVTLSGPGASWRELSLRCLVGEEQGGESANGEDEAGAALRRLEEAMAALEDSSRCRGPPAEARDPSGNLALAKASRLLQLGRIEEARSVCEAVSSGSLAPGGGLYGTGEQVDRGGARGGTRAPHLHRLALCVASDVELAEGRAEEAKAKLRTVLEADDGFVDALSRLGWILLGFGRLGQSGLSPAVQRQSAKAGDEEGPGAALPLLERACQLEPNSSDHALRLAR